MRIQAWWLLAAWLPMVLLARLSLGWADRLGISLGRLCAELVSGLPEPPGPRELLWSAEPVEPGVAEKTWSGPGQERPLERANVLASGALVPRGSASRDKARRRLPSWPGSEQSNPLRHGLRVPAEMVLQIVRSGSRPNAVPVRARGERPAGLLLTNVSCLGVGLQDGDILTEAAGRPTLEVEDLVASVVSARRRCAREITGRFWRDGEQWELVVEQPYPPHRGPPLSAGKPLPGPSLACEPQARGEPGRPRGN